MLTDQVLPLLDGLDEVKVEHRAACVEAINVFRQSHGFLPLVITSRTADYEALAEPLRLHGAILVQPLSREQVNAYLADLGPAGEPVRAAIHEDSSLWELLDSPLLLNIVTVAYAGQPEAPSPVSGTVVERRDHLFGSYVNQMLRRRAAERRYTTGADDALAELAGLSDGQAWPDGLLSRATATRLAPPKTTMGHPGLYRADQRAGRRADLRAGRRAGQRAARPASRRADLGAGRRAGPRAAKRTGRAGRRTVAALVLLSKEIVCVDTVRWSWSNCWRSGSSRLMVAVGLIAGLITGLGFEPQIGLAARLIAVLVVGIFYGLLAGVTFSQIETRAIPNEGIHRSARIALAVGLVFGLVSLAFGRLDRGRAAGWPSEWASGCSSR